MNNSLSPYDLGNNTVLENYKKIRVEDLVRNAKRMLKKTLVEAQIEALGVTIELVTSATKFNGERIWLKCPQCSKRVGTLFNKNGIRCRKCAGLMYRNQRYKGMVEE